jgi:hypothetical protein
MKNPRETIANAMARAMYVSAWADHQEAMGRRLRGELMDQAPATPRRAKDDAFMLIGRFECLNGMDIFALLYAAYKADGFDPYQYPPDEKYEKEFGHYLAMQALGHGVSWFDDHAKFPIKFPHIEFDL